jgi:integral membrane protein
MPTRTVQSLKSISKKIRYIAVAEGMSYLILLTLSILKRTTSIDVHTGIQYVGMLHGILFILFLIAIGAGIFILKWSFSRALWAFVTSLLPFGTFVLDAQLIKEENKMV